MENTSVLHSENIPLQNIIKKLLPQDATSEEVASILDNGPGLMDIVSTYSKGNTEANMILANAFSKGNFGVQPSFQKEFKIYKKLAEEGDPIAQNRVGDMCYEQHNFKRAVIWFRRSAEQGDAYGQYKLGMMYRQGYAQLIDDQHKKEKAYDWYQKAAEQGFPPAINQLGDIYFEIGNYKKALRYYKKAAEEGYVYAWYGIGKIYEHSYMYGFGSTYTKEDAFECYMKAAEEGYSYAQREVAGIYGSGDFANYDPKKSAEWLDRSNHRNQYVIIASQLESKIQSAEDGNIDEWYQIGNMYYDNSIEQDYEKAFNYYMKAAEQGHTNAQCKIGELYRYGSMDGMREGIELNYTKAIEWLDKAVEKGNADAMFYLYEIYSDYSSDYQDFEKAGKYLGMAAANGSITATQILLPIHGR